LLLLLLLLLQELVNVMWAISCMDWSPPMLYWRGLLDAARSNFGRFNPQDLANCISAGGQPVLRYRSAKRNATAWPWLG
jgi:hypothetical protein